MPSAFVATSNGKKRTILISSGKALHLIIIFVFIFVTSVLANSELQMTTAQLRPFTQASPNYPVTPSSTSTFSDNAELPKSSGQNPQCAKFSVGGMPGLNEFASPNFPLKYPPNVDCVRMIRAPPEYDIVLHFRDIFQIESAYKNEDASGSYNNAKHSPNCPNDFLEVRDGRYNFSPLIGRFCGMQAPEMEIRARSGFIWLNFHSDSLLEYRGFSASFEFVRSQANNGHLRPECHFSITHPLDGYVDSTDLHSLFSKTHQATTDQSVPFECVWQIDVPRWLSVALFIEHFDLNTPNQCHANALEIYVGAIARAPLRRYCSSTLTHFYSGKSTVSVRFIARDFAHLMGSRFRVLFSTYIPLKNCSERLLFACGDDICIPTALLCNGRSNCLYRKDEHNCPSEIDLINHFLRSGYAPLLALISLFSLVVAGLCLYYSPCKKYSLRQSFDASKIGSTDFSDHSSLPPSQRRPTEDDLSISPPQPQSTSIHHLNTLMLEARSSYSSASEWSLSEAMQDQPSNCVPRRLKNQQNGDLNRPTMTIRRPTEPTIEIEEDVVWKRRKKDGPRTSLSRTTEKRVLFRQKQLEVEVEENRNEPQRERDLSACRVVSV